MASWDPTFDPKNMVYRNLGRTGLKVSLFSLGGWLTYGKQVKGDPVKECIRAAWSAGINFFDSAEIYGNGGADEEMGRAIKELGINRRELVMSTKVFFGTGRKDPNQRGLSRKHIVEGVQDSLKRLQMDYVDIILAHRPDVNTPMLEVVRSFNHVIDRGLAFYWGTSEWSAVQLQEAYAVAHAHNLIPPNFEQPQYHLLHRDRVEREYDPLYPREGLGLMIWSPLASGLLTGKYNDGIPPDSRFAKEPDFFKNTIDSFSQEDGKAKIAKVKKLGELAQKIGIPQSQLALAWAAKNPNVSSVILGASRPEQITENVKALDVLDKLTPEVMKEIDEILGNKPTPNPTYGR